MSTAVPTYDRGMTEQRTPYEFIESGGYIEGHRIEDVDFSTMVEPGLRILDTQFIQCDFTGTDFSNGHLSKVSFDTVNAPQLQLHDSGLQDIDITHSRLGGIQAYATNWQRARITESKIEFLNLRDSKLTRMQFENCAITELDLTGATLKNVVFKNCTIGKLIMTRANCTQVDLRGADLGSVTDFAGLKGTTMSLPQFIDLAPDFAAILGVHLK